MAGQAQLAQAVGGYPMAPDVNADANLGNVVDKVDLEKDGDE
jgi:hypothetical protein